MAFKKISSALGNLENEIMEVMWELKKASVRQVLDILRKKRKIAYTTVMTVMLRLSTKGILKRKLEGSGAYLYYLTKSKEQFQAEASRQVVTNLITEFGEVAVAQFIDAVETSDLDNLSAWRKKLKTIRQNANK